MPDQGIAFVGHRLKEARTIRGITASALATATGIHASAISHYEKGRYTPPPARLNAMAEALQFKVDFFLRPLQPDARERQVVFERSRSNTTKTTRRRAEYRREWLREIVAFLDQYLDMPTPSLPPSIGTCWKTLTGDEIEYLANKTRRYWSMGDGPISNVTLLAENNGVIVTRLCMDSTRLDAFSAWDVVDGRPYIILGDDGQSACRVRFNVCHELGHLILHREVTRDEWEDAPTFRKIEQQAHRFAAALLTPKSSVAADLRHPTLNSLRLVKTRWKVAIKMLIHRAQELGFVDDSVASRLYANYSRREWQKMEPYDDQWPVERPVMLKRAFEALDKRSLVELSQIPAALPFNQADIEQLTGLPNGYLNQDIWRFLDSLTTDFPSAGSVIAMRHSIAVHAQI